MKRLNYFLFIISSLFIMSCNMDVDSLSAGSTSSSSSSSSSSSTSTTTTVNTTNASSTTASGATSLTSEVKAYNVSLSGTNSTNGLPSFIYNWSNSYSPNTATRPLITEKSPSDLTFANTLYLNLSDLTVSSDGSDYSEITSDGTVTGNITTSISETGLITLTDSSSTGNDLKVILSGSASGKSLFISANKNNSVAIYLNSVSLTSGSYPCIQMDKKNPVYLVAEGSNTFTDGRSYGTDYSSTSSKKGTIYTKGGLIMSGSGSITLNEGYKHGFFSNDYIQVNSGTYTVNSTGRNAFQAANAFVMNDGTITISGTGTHTNNQSRGIIVEGWDYDTDDEEANEHLGEGYIVINGGTITSTTVSKGISAKWDIDDDAVTSDTSDDPYPFVLVTGGKISITTTGTPQNESSSYYTFTDADGDTVSEKTKLSPEGIEGKQALFITGGIVELTTTDDCLNVSRDTSGYKGKIEIYGGNIFAYSSGNDAIDSNGTLTLAGGIIVALTSTTPECAFDCDSNTFAITGGLLVGIGTNNYSAPTSSACSQSTIVLSGNYFGSGNTTFALEDSSGNAVFAYTIPSVFGTSTSSNYIMILSSPEIQTGTSYKAVSGVSASGGTTFHNLYVELPEVSSGSTSVSGISTSSSSYVYTKSSSSNNGAMEGPHPNRGF
ncbi:carbohydrate-binding domain-containing protein [Treponema sp. JC4]|uniref:carbohydrate-binding domain-containing protein n=1 Tax=Treponema sp. JC4 TaxID=1124982 RepID=UPI0009DB405A|nr:carbohydrate-binding domain-containing protein [Treponema sp. JC4]